MDSRVMESLKKKNPSDAKGDINDVSCMCGEPLPVRRHWVHECTAIPRPLTAPTRCEAEHALGVRFAPSCKPAAKRKNDREPIGLVNLLRRIRNHLHKCGNSERVLAASDGGVLEPAKKWVRIGSWGIAVDASAIGKGIVTFSGIVEGIDQSTKAAELQGAYIFIRAVW